MSGARGEVEIVSSLVSSEGDTDLVQLVLLDLVALLGAELRLAGRE